MEFYKDYDNKLLWDFVKMKEKDEPKVLVLAGPYCSGKTTLSSFLLKEIKLFQKTELSLEQKLSGFEISPINPKNDYYRLKVPNNRSVLLVHESRNIEQSFYEHCYNILSGHITFWPIYTNYEQRSIFKGNQCIMEKLSDRSIFINDKRFVVVNLKKIENPVKETIIKSCNFKAWLVGFDQACMLAIMMILVFRNSNLSAFPKDIIRMLIVQIVRESYYDYWEKEFCEMVKL